MIKKYIRTGLMLMVTLNCSPLFANADNATIYQAGTLLNIANMVYEGSESLDDLTQHGDFGLGTVNGAKGEMVIVDGKAYLGDSQGKAEEIPLDTKTPFSMVVTFEPTETFYLNNIQNLEELKQALDKKLPNNNIFYAIKIEGQFTRVVMRDIDPPVKPYIPIDKWLAKHQHVFNLQDVPGTMVAFRSPQYMNPLTIIGYHLHFINADHTMLGHVYDLQFVQAKVSIEPVYNYLLLLPDSEEFMDKKFQTISKSTVTKVENNK